MPSFDHKGVPITEEQRRCLVYIARHPQTTGATCEETNVYPSTASALTKRGLLTMSPTKRRGKVYRLTDEGAKIAVQFEDIPHRRRQKKRKLWSFSPEDPSELKRRCGACSTRPAETDENLCAPCSEQRHAFEIQGAQRGCQAIEEAGREP